MKVTEDDTAAPNASLSAEFEVGFSATDQWIVAQVEQNPVGNLDRSRPFVNGGKAFSGSNGNVGWQC